MDDVKIIVSNDVIKCMTRLPNTVQSKALEFMLKFQTDPRSTGINLEENQDIKVGVMANTTRLRDQLAKHVREAGYKVATINHRERLSRKDAQIFAMTLHRAKGIEFDAVAIVVNKEMNENMRKLLYVGMTRAKRMAQLYI
jgi:superfamily I DNA/RNA helicase